MIQACQPAPTAAEPTPACQAAPPVGQLVEMWVSAERVAAALGRSLRAARYRLTGLTSRSVPTRGRPKLMYYIGDQPDLLAQLAQAQLPPEPTPEPILKEVEAEANMLPLSAIESATAQLRGQAVNTYLHLRRGGVSEDIAAATVVAEWRAHPRTWSQPVRERIGRHTRKLEQSVTVGGFSLRTLRGWASLYIAAGKDWRALAPRLRGQCGRPEAEIPAGLIDLLILLAAASPRGDIAKARRWVLAKARNQWPESQWPKCHYSTIVRRVAQRDPSKIWQTLGHHGNADFLAEHTPDIEVDWTKLPLNGQWQIDDVTMDFYGHSSVKILKLFRPIAYAVKRTATRQWVAAVVLERKIRQENVRELLGHAMASKAGGIPEAIVFENGAVACDAYLRQLLERLGVKVKITAMQGGCVIDGAAPDRGRGNPRGKAVIERDNQQLHEICWDVSTQVGSDERDAPARTEMWKQEAKRLAREGKVLSVPSGQEITALVFQRMEQFNNTPHGGLPEIVDPETGEIRHMTPNERAAQLSAEGQAIEPMSDELLPLFACKCHIVQVSRNGIRINDETFGRFDRDLAALVGEKVHAYTDPLNERIFVEEIGRCVQIDRKAHPDDTSRHFAGKTLIKQDRLALFDEIRRNGLKDATFSSQIRIQFNPASNVRPARAPQTLLDEVHQLVGGRMLDDAAKAADAARFAPPTGDRRAAATTPRRGGLMAEAARISAAYTETTSAPA